MFTIDDIIQIAFFQGIYVLLLFYLTLREIKRTSKTILLWLIFAVDVLYITMIAWLTNTISAYAVQSVSALFRWNTLLLSILIPALLLLLAFSVYHVKRDINYNKQLKQL